MGILIRADGTREQLHARYLFAGIGITVRKRAIFRNERSPHEFHAEQFLIKVRRRVADGDLDRLHCMKNGGIVFAAHEGRHTVSAILG